MANKDEIVERLVKQLGLAREIRASFTTDAETAARRELLREWQAARLARTHADLRESPRFNATTAFFLTDIYGPKDLSRHEDDVERLLPVMTRVLPATGIETVADAVELNVLSESLDMAMVGALGARVENISPSAYGAAYREVGRRPDRERQIALIGHIGHCLDRLTHSRLIGMALTTMRKPARLAGLDELQTFLERGYTAFREMGGADDFLREIVTRETRLMDALLAGDDSLL